MSRQPLRRIAIALCAALAACSGEGDGADTGRVQSVIGPEGGTIELTDPGHAIYGVKLEVAPGAMTQKTTFSIEYGGFPSKLPAGFSYDHPLVQFGPSASFDTPLQITFPVDYVPTSDGDILAAYCRDAANTRWMVTPARRVEGGSSLIVWVNQLALCTWGTVRLADVDPDTAKDWMDQQYPVDNWEQLGAQVLSDIQPLVDAIENKTVVYCSTQDDILQALADLQTTAISNMTAYLTTVQREGVCELCDFGNFNCNEISHCDPEALISGQPVIWLQNEIRIWWRSMAIGTIESEVVGDLTKWGEGPGSAAGSAAAGDIAGSIVEKTLSELMYREAARELGCDWRCVVRHGDGNFWLPLLVGNVAGMSIIGIATWRANADPPCIN